jgi:hypothetical protein
MPLDYSNENNFTFNKFTTVGASAGYYSRVLFTFVPCKYGYNGGVANTIGTGWSGTDTNILEYFVSSSDYSGCHHGGFDIPPDYWEKGKTIRMKGTLVCASEGGSQTLNLGFGLKDITNNVTYLLGSTNNGVDHSFLDGGSGGPLPVDFELNICLYQSGEAYGYGFYTYDTANYSSAGANRLIKYVPVWNGSTLSSTSALATTRTRIYINGYGSTIDSAYLTNLIIEELA